MNVLRNFSKASLAAAVFALGSAVAIDSAQAQSRHVGGGQGGAHFSHSVGSHAIGSRPIGSHAVAGRGYSRGGYSYVRGGYYGGPRGGYRYGPHYGYGRGLLWGGVGLGLGLGLGSYYGSPWYPSDPGYVVVDPPVVYGTAQPVPLLDSPVPTRSAAYPAPVVYPRNGQSQSQIDADGNACSQWAGSQPNATTDGSVFQRANAACMDARGYTVR